MKIINLVKSEFKKNFSIKKLILSIIVLLISSIFLMNICKEEEIIPVSNIESQIESSTTIYDELSAKENKTIEDEYSINYHKNMIELLKTIQYNGDVGYWGFPYVFDVVSIQGTNYLIEKMDEDSNICSSINYSSTHVLNEIYDLCNNYTYQEREKLFEENEKIIAEYKDLLQSGKYYLFLEYEINHNKLEATEFTNLLIEKKEEKSDSLLSKNYQEYMRIIDNSSFESLKERSMNDKKYKNVVEIKERQFEKYKAILLYSAEKGIKHDISYEYYDNNASLTPNAKRVVNQVYHLSFIVMLLISIMYGGIVSNEHNKGTIKNIISAPIRRWKILLSKFIYLILNTYILLFLGLIILSICTGIQYGFEDLFTPKLIYMSNKVIEVNYYLYMIKNIFIISIPLLCYLSILFFLSTVTLNTSITVGITSIISVLSPVVWLMSLYWNFKHIVYTPIWYFDLGFIFNNDFRYIESLMCISYSWQNQIILLFIIGIILYILTTIIYSKRDIKN